MSSYFLVYIMMAFAALGGSRSRSLVPWIVTGIFFTLYIGFRHYVGGDWNNYMRHFEEMALVTLEEVLKDEDPGYYLINLWMYEWGWGIYGVNVICALLFMIGLIRLSRQQFNPWLSMAVAVPYLIIVVSMGYTRQGVAVGLVMWAIAVLGEKKFIRFLILVSLAATFHKSAVLMVGIGLFGHERGRLLKVLAVGFVGLGIYGAFLAEHQDQLVDAYITDARLESQGAMIRVLMNFVPAILLFMFRRSWQHYYSDYAFWRILALGSIAALFVVNFATTAVDRMALYMIPLQIVVFGRLPLLARHILSSRSIIVAILLYYALVLFVWLNFGGHASFWIPYQNIIFESLF